MRSASSSPPRRRNGADLGHQEDQTQSRDRAEQRAAEAGAALTESGGRHSDGDGTYEDPWPALNHPRTAGEEVATTTITSAEEFKLKHRRRVSGTLFEVSFVWTHEGTTMPIGVSSCSCRLCIAEPSYMRLICSTTCISTSGEMGMTDKRRLRERVLLWRYNSSHTR